MPGGLPPRPAPKPKISDEEFLKQLEGDPTYEGIAIRVVEGKMRNWCEVHGKKPTRKTLINWLNREDRPMKPATSGQTVQSGPKGWTA